MSINIKTNCNAQKISEKCLNSLTRWKYQWHLQHDTLTIHTRECLGGLDTSCGHPCLLIMPGYISIHIVLSIVLYTFELENKHKQQVLELKLLKYLHQISIIYLPVLSVAFIRSDWVLPNNPTRIKHVKNYYGIVRGRNSGSSGPGPDRHHPAAAAGKSFKSCHVESINFFAAVPTGKTFQ